MKDWLIVSLMHQDMSFADLYTKAMNFERFTSTDYFAVISHYIFLQCSAYFLFFNNLTLCSQVRSIHFESMSAHLIVTLTFTSSLLWTKSWRLWQRRVKERWVPSLKGKEEKKSYMSIHRLWPIPRLAIYWSTESQYASCAPSPPSCI